MQHISKRRFDHWYKKSVRVLCFRRLCKLLVSPQSLQSIYLPSSNRSTDESRVGPMRGQCLVMWGLEAEEATSDTEAESSGMQHCTAFHFAGSSDKEKTQLAMRSLRPEHFSTSEVVLHTCGPTQTVAKCVLWSIKYLFMLRGAYKINTFYLRPYITGNFLLFKL